MYSRIIAHLFYLTLTCTVLSPYIGGSTLYFYVLLPLFDPEFYKYIGKVVNATQGKIFFVFLVAIGCCGLSLSLPARIISITIVVLYSFYSYDKKFFYLYGYVVFNVLWGIVQFAFSYVDPSVAYLLGPTNISTLLWGSYAGPSFTNFYEIFLLTRVSGLSREAGFFASLLATTFVISLFDQRLVGRRKLLYMFLAMGFVISLSKMSLVILILIPVMIFRKTLKATNLALFTIILLTLITLGVDKLYYQRGQQYNISNISITHRTSGYEFVTEMDADDLLMGISLPDLKQKYKNTEIVNLLSQFVGDTFDFPGWAGVAITSGLISFGLCLAYMGLLGVNGFYMTILTLLCINISPFAVTASSAMAWFAIFLQLYRGRAVAIPEEPAENEPHPRLPMIRDAAAQEGVS